MRDSLPIVMVRNESRLIQGVLRPLVTVFGRVVLGDTGSTDGTAELAEAMPGVEVQRMGVLSPADLGQARRQLGQRVMELGYRNVFMVDGDELYSVEALRHMLTQQFPDERSLLFTRLQSLDEDADGTIWELDNATSRTAVFRADEPWSGAYPYELPKIFSDGGPFRYFSLPEGLRYHGVHAHRLRRSGADAAVFGRTQKQDLYSMQKVPGIKRTIPFDMNAWLQRSCDSE